jgi:membrane-associated phospholipid phosphatase
MNSDTKTILGKVATVLYLTSAVMAVVCTISLASFPGGPASMGYAAMFVLLLVLALLAVVTIAAVGRLKEKRKIVLIGAIAWPLPIIFSAAVLRALYFAP